MILRNRLRLLRLFASLLPLCAGCSRPGRTPATAVVIAVDTNPRSLDPRFATDALASKLVELTCPGLVARDVDGALVPELSESWTWETPVRLAFRLRPGVVFSDGSPVEAEDVASTYASILDPATASVFAGALAEVERVEARGAAEAVFHLRAPSAPVLQDLVNPGVMRRGPSAKDAAGFPVCAGAFKPVAFRRDEAVELAANPRYWRGAPAIPRIVVRVVPDATIRVLEAAHGSVDLLQNDFPPHFLRVLRERKDLVVETAPGRNVKYLVFNLSHPALADVRVRRAMALAVDRDSIVRFKLDGLGRLATGLLAPEDPYFDGSIQGLAHDPAEAERLLDEAGLRRGQDGVRVRLEYKTSTNETAIAIAKVLKRNWADVGIEVTIRPAEWGIFFHDVQTGNFQLYSLTLTGVVDPDVHRWMLHSENVPPGGSLSNRGGYRNPELDRLLERGGEETDPARRREIYAEAQRIVARDLPVLPLWYESVVAVRSRELTGYRLSPFASFVGLAGAVKRPAVEISAP